MTARTVRSRDDVVTAAGRLFAQRGYHGTSMRDLAAELGLLGSSLYSHISSKEDLLVEVVERGGSLFSRSAEAALSTPGPAAQRLKALVAGHVAVVLDHLDEVRTFLNEAWALDEPHRERVLAARNHYEAAFRATLDEGREDGSFRVDLDSKLAAIFILSVLNAIERWYRPSGRLDRAGLVEEILQFVWDGIRAP
ncbi:MAG TPA: TetR/AcrR family transcriptional regulator [Acidimicrobiia bacterium]|nr:TetR/AcrR family transcriptional regulator [Acidimicrobiia bacterium]